MELKRINVLSAGFGTLLPYPSSVNPTDGFFNDDGQIVFGVNGTTLHLAQPITEYLWLELVFTGRSIAGNSNVHFEVRTIDGMTQAVVSGDVPIQQGSNSVNFFKVPNVGTIQEISMEAIGGFDGPVKTAVLEQIIVVKNHDSLVVRDAVPLNRGSLSTLAGFVYNAAGGYYEADIISGAPSVFPAVNFSGLTPGSEYGIVTVQPVANAGEDVNINATPDGYTTTSVAPVTKYVYTDPTLNVFPSILAIFNGGPRTAHVRIYVQLGSFLDTNISAFGLSAQIPSGGSGVDPYNPLKAFGALTGYIFAAAGVATAVLPIPVTDVDFTAGIVPVANINTLTVATALTANDLKLTRTGAGFANTLGSLWYKDAGGYVTPTNGDKLSYRYDLGTSGAMGLGVIPADGTLLNLDASVTGFNSGGPRIPINIYSRSLVGSDSGLYGVKTDLNAPNAAVTLPFIYHFAAGQTNVAAPATITEVRGFYAPNAIAKGSTNTGFYSDINKATNTNQLALAGTAPSYFNSEVGFGGNISGTGGSLLFCSLSTAALAGGVDKIGISLRNASPSSATSNVVGVQVINIGTVNSAYALSALTGFWAQSFVKGAASSITTVYGFRASNAIAVATTNYGFWSDIASAANVWQVYMNGTAQSYFGGPVGILNNDPFGGGILLRIQGTHPSALATTVAEYINTTHPATSTTAIQGVTVNLQTAAAAFTVTTIDVFRADTITLGGASVATTVRGFYASTNITKATTNYGFYSDIASASGNYQLRMAGTAKSRFDGSVGVFTDPAANVVFHASVAGVSGGGSVGYYASGIFPSTVTTTALGFQAQLQTANTAVTYAELTGFRVDTWTRGAASAITGCYGFRVESNFAVSLVNNYAFYTNINNATTNWAFYGAGTANSFFGGIVGIGTAATNTESFRVDSNIANLAGTTIFGINVQPTVPVAATVAYSSNGSSITTQNTGVTYAIISHYWAKSLTKGAASTITTAIGFYASDAGFTGAANSYAFYSDVASGSGKFQLAMLGTALNILQGGLVLATTAAPAVAAGQLSLGATVATTVGAAGAAAALPANPVGYWIINVAGTQMKVPYL
jgi:hypothetical protein